MQHIHMYDICILYLVNIIYVCKMSVRAQIDESIVTDDEAQTRQQRQRQ